ncbi:YdcF family protein [uncultured Azonexus sp.]|uniref:YdcF family protein n=1 Tax=uncultured Azonexus sp. TaxID=520307 RepID=UPI00262F4CD8|nr:YdcF family protein [uncultured Azonexus sp.]
MLYLHKLLPLLLSPIVVVILLAAWGALRKRRGPVLLALMLLYLASMPLLAKYLVSLSEAGAVRLSAESQPPANAIVVLSGMLATVAASDGVATEWGDFDRFLGGIELYEAGRAPRLIFTAGAFPWRPEATPEGLYLKQFAERLGVPARDILVSDLASNTEQEAQAIRRLLPEAQPSILLVPSAYHMPRATQLFLQAGFTVHPYPVDFLTSVEQTTLMDFLPSAHHLRLTDIVVREWIGRLYYRGRSAF